MKKKLNSFIYYLENLSKFSQLGLIFSLCLISRIIFRLCHPADNFELFADSYRYDILSDRILNGNHDLDFIAFIIAPLYPYTTAVVKYIFSAHWMFGLQSFQFILVSISAIYVFLLADRLFKTSFISWLSTFIYILYPFTLYYNFTFTQETTFQCYFIITVYYLISYFQKTDRFSLALSAVFFSLSYLTKSHILLFAPFIALLILIHSQGVMKRWTNVILFTGLCLLFSLPGGLNNLDKHEVYTFSSFGTSTFFHNGNSSYYYEYLFNPPEENRHDYLYYIFGEDFEFPGYGQINKLPHKEKSSLHRELALNWIKSNPSDFLKLKAFNFYAFFRPGLNKLHYSFPMWLLGLICSLPIYILAYYGIFISFRENKKAHLWILFLMTTVLLFFIIFMAQNRFRTITLDAFYIIYASYSVHYFLSKKKFLL